MQITFEITDLNIQKEMILFSESMGLASPSLAVKAWFELKLMSDIAYRNMLCKDYVFGIDLIDRLSRSISDNLYKTIKNATDSSGELHFPDDLKMPVESLPFDKAIKTRIIQALHHAKIYTLGDIINKSVNDLNKIPTLGCVSVAAIRHTLLNLGIKLKVNTELN